jgi:hypothetical protein
MCSDRLKPAKGLAPIPGDLVALAAKIGGGLPGPALESPYKITEIRKSQHECNLGYRQAALLNIAQRDLVAGLIKQLLE